VAKRQLLLSEPIRRLQSEAAWLRQEFYSASLQKYGRKDQLAAEMAIVRLYDAWARYCRELIILSASGNTVTLSGAVVPAVVSKRSDVVPTLLSTFKKQQYEPKWASAPPCIDAAKRLNISNLSTVSAALSASNSPAEEIRNVRNFYAHRKKGAASLALSCNRFRGKIPNVFELSSYGATGVPHMDEWIDGLILVATAASQ
jgi:hypothetical protein